MLKNSQKDCKKLFFDTRATESKLLSSYRALLRIRSYAKTSFKKSVTNQPFNSWHTLGASAQSCRKIHISVELQKINVEL